MTVTFLPTRRKKSKDTVVTISPRLLRTITPIEVRDLDGYYVGFLSDSPRGQATMVSRVLTAETVTTDALATWEASLVGMDNLLATVATVTVAGDDVSWSLSATMTAADKVERKDPSELVTRLATTAPAIYRQAGDCGFPSRPLSIAEVTSYSQYFWSPEHTAVWPPVATSVEESSQTLTIDDTTHVVFEITCDGADTTLDSLTTIIQTLGPQVDATLQLARVFRPAASMDETSSGRRVGLLTIAHPADRQDAGTYLAALILSQLDARSRLRVRRLTSRQQVGVLMAVGLGVLGWQHLEVTL